jgi:ferredoxin
VRIIVDWSLCDGNGLCAKEAPQLLAMDADDGLHVLKEDFTEQERESAERAVIRQGSVSMTLTLESTSALSM